MSATANIRAGRAYVEVTAEKRTICHGAASRITTDGYKRNRQFRSNLCNP